MRNNELSNLIPKLIIKKNKEISEKKYNLHLTEYFFFLLSRVLLLQSGIH
jgi:hypothetical protein